MSRSSSWASAPGRHESLNRGSLASTSSRCDLDTGATESSPQGRELFLTAASSSGQWKPARAPEGHTAQDSTGVDLGAPRLLRPGRSASGTRTGHAKIRLAPAAHSARKARDKQQPQPRRLPPRTVAPTRLPPAPDRPADPRSTDARHTREADLAVPTLGPSHVLSPQRQTEPLSAHSRGAARAGGPGWETPQEPSPVSIEPPGLAGCMRSARKLLAGCSRHSSPQPPAGAPRPGPSTRPRDLFHPSCSCSSSLSRRALGDREEISPRA